MPDTMFVIFFLTRMEIHPNWKKVSTFKTAPKSDYAYNLESTVSHRVSGIADPCFSGVLQCDFLSTLYAIADDRNDSVVFNRSFVDQQTEGHLIVGLCDC